MELLYFYFRLNTQKNATVVFLRRVTCKFYAIFRIEYFFKFYNGDIYVFKNI